MKYNVLYILTIVVFTTLSTHAQRGIRIAYIDTEYILENVPNYTEANAQLDKKVQEWKSDIDKKLNAIETKKQELEAERILLTKELYEERLEDIKIEENEVLDYQQKRFGPEGDLITQKNQLVQPVQDQIFATVQEIAEARNYDFIFDKSADLTILFSAKQYDISEQVLRSITRSTGRRQAQTKEERREAEAEELAPEINESLEDRQKALEEKKDARRQEAETRRQQQLEEREAAKEAAAARRQQIIDERAKAREEKMGNSGRTTADKDSTTDASKQSDNSGKTPQELMAEQRAEKLKEREQKRQEALEARNISTPPSIGKEAEKEVEKTVTKDSISDAKDKTPQELMAEERARKIKEREEKRQEILDAKKAQTGNTDEKPAEKSKNSTAAEKPLTAKEKMEAERQKKIDEREARRKELEDRKKKILEDRKKEKEEAEKKADSIKNN